jgi:KipI family sensor histidine kinase inhibitor
MEVNSGGSMPAMAWRALGDRAWLIEAEGRDAGQRLAAALAIAREVHAARISGVTDVVSSFDTVAVHFEDPCAGDRVLEVLEGIAGGDGGMPVGGGAVLRVPVAYGGEHGPDLEQAAVALGMEIDQLIRLHGEPRYTVAAVGFSPGFPYLTGLPAPLHLPRKKTPQPVAAGAVAIAGGQAGIYPHASQGGWHVIGRTPVMLFDVGRSDPALLKPGDRVRFVPEAAFVERHDSVAPDVAGDAALEIIAPGLQTMVQDPGRPGFQKIGVSPGGACDPLAAMVANRLVGNSDDAALLECGMTGPVLRLLRDACVAWVGWADETSGRPHDLPAGTVIDLRRRMTSLRGYFAIAGGIDVPVVLGSRATDLRAGIGGWQGRCLREGDHLPAGRPQAGLPHGAWRVSWPLETSCQDLLEIRFLRGVQWEWFSDESREAFTRGVYQVSTMSDRTGSRLDGPALGLREAREMVSQPVVAGSVQVPADGRPIVLLCERQTIGGYPQIAHVISADLPRLARAWPGARLRMREVTLEEAREAWRAQQRELASLKAGLLLKGVSGNR